MAKVSCRIDQDGNVHFEVNGVEGASCETLTEGLVRAMGEADGTQFKEEYVQTLPDYISAHEE